jgi:hypothetical protein
VLTGPSRLRELRREPLDPRVDAHVVDLDASFGEMLLDVPVGQAEPRRYQRTARVMTSGGNRNPAKADLGAGQEDAGVISSRESAL